MKLSKRLIGILFFLSLAGAGWLAANLFFEQRSMNSMLTGEGAEHLPPFTFNDLEGRPRSSEEWQGKVLVVNFWATWCPPCRREMPLFIETQKRYANRGLQFVAIAIDDLDMVKDFSDVYGLNFPVLIGSTEAIKLANKMGNRFDTLPFTAIYDSDGMNSYVHAGEVTEETLADRLLPLL